VPSEVLTSRIEREVFFRTFIRGPKPPPGFAKQLIDAMQEDFYPAGSIIYQKGARSEFIHYVVRGKVELIAEGMRPFSFGSRSAIGGLDAFQDQPYSRTAVAIEDTVCLRVKIEDYFDIMEDNFEFAKLMLAALYRASEELSRQLTPEQIYPELGAAPPIDLAAGARLGLVERLILIRSVRVFQRVRLQPLVRLAQLADERRLDPGERLWSEKGSSEAIWIVAAGRVGVTRDEPPFSALFGPGNAVATLAVVGGLDAVYSARALDHVLALRVPKEDLVDVMEDHSELVRGLLAFAAAERSRLQTLITEARRGSSTRGTGLMPAVAK
jgi:CRP-like cAMP-binding protein